MAVLDGPRLKIFDLPAMSTEDRTKYLAMQADAPALVAPASRNPGENAEEVFDVADNSDQESPKAVPVAAPTPGVQQQAPAAAQTSAAPDGIDNSTITFKTSSKTVVVDVVVTDSKGHPARGLSAEDFQLQEDGKSQRVNYFHEFIGNSANTSNAPAVEQISAAGPTLVMSHEPTPAPPKPAEALKRKSVAVLYFENLSGNCDDEYFRDGMTEVPEEQAKEFAVRALRAF